MLMVYHLHGTFCRCSEIVPAWEKAWEKTKARADKNRKPASILPALVRAFGPSFLVSIATTLVYSCVQFVNPQMVNLLINFVESDDPNWKGYLYTALIVVTSFFNTIINAQSFYIQYSVGYKLKTALTSAIYKKAFKLSNVGRKEMSGKLSNMLT